jgi:hypothetical protein
MNEVIDYMDMGANLPWQWPVAALLCWGIVLCLALIFLHPDQRTRGSRSPVGRHRPFNRP